jgi:hypothetical protein
VQPQRLPLAASHLATAIEMEDSHRQIPPDPASLWRT